MLILVQILSFFLALHTGQALFNQKQCTQACLSSSSDTVRQEICQRCAENPPLGLQMCAVACRYPEHPYLSKIAPLCMKSVKLTDRMCIVACMNYATSPCFHDICTRCRHNPPITGKMCRFACDHGVTLSTVCASCAQTPPNDNELCDYACTQAFTPRGAYYKLMCETCKYRFQIREDASKYKFRPLDKIR